MSAGIVVSISSSSSYGSIIFMSKCSKAGNHLTLTEVLLRTETGMAGYTS